MAPVPARTMLLYAALLVATIGVRCNAREVYEPFILEDEAPDEDTDRIRKEIRTQCDKSIKALGDGHLRVWASFFMSQEPSIHLPGERNIRGIMQIEKYVDVMEDQGINNYTFNVTSDVMISDTVCTFHRISTWRLGSCFIEQPAYMVC